MCFQILSSMKLSFLTHGFLICSLIVNFLKSLNLQEQFTKLRLMLKLFNLLGTIWFLMLLLILSRCDLNQLRISTSVSDKLFEVLTCFLLFKGHSLCSATHCIRTIIHLSWSSWFTVTWPIIIMVYDSLDWFGECMNAGQQSHTARRSSEVVCSSDVILTSWPTLVCKPGQWGGFIGLQHTS